MVAATRIDPLRPDNSDFDLVGPGWLSVTTFALAAILHGMAVVAIANRYSHVLPPRAIAADERARVLLPLVPAALLLVPGVSLLVPLGLGLALAVAAAGANASPGPPGATPHCSPAGSPWQRPPSCSCRAPCSTYAT